MNEQHVKRVVVAAVARVTGIPEEQCGRLDASLERDLGVDSLTLLELVENLQGELRITVPDEVTARIRTVADLLRAVHTLVADTPTPTLTRERP